MPRDKTKKKFNEICNLALKLGEDGSFSEQDIRLLKTAANKMGGIGVRMEDMNSDGVDEVVLEKFSGEFEATYFKINKNTPNLQPVQQWIYPSTINYENPISSGKEINFELPPEEPREKTIRKRGLKGLLRF